MFGQILIIVAVSSLSTVDISPQATPNKPLSLHPDNAHYFLFRGKPALLITSAEHYGAVLNLDFNYVKYLDELQTHGLNLTRTFSGVYREDEKAFGIARNTLAPADGKFICPWARSSKEGYAGGGNKFDLKKWDDAYFTRLKDFLAQASKRGIVVELVLFCPFYEDSMWNLSPMNAANNINDLGKLNRNEPYDRTKNGGLQSYQEAVVKKIVAETNEYDNLYFEVCNEPYFGGVTDDWQRRIIDVIVETEKNLPNEHLISQNIANGSKKIEKPHPKVSIFNFHYCSPPDAFKQNEALNKAIGENETGFKGTGDQHYRMEGWEFVLAGGALYNNLDYSFSVGYEDGTFPYPASSPGGGNRGFRQQMKVLKDFIHSFDFVKMKPDHSVVERGLPARGRARALSEPGKQYAIYLFGGPMAKLELALSPGRYIVQWIDPASGLTLESSDVIITGMLTLLPSPVYESDIALRIVAKK